MADNTKVLKQQESEAIKSNPRNEYWYRRSEQTIILNERNALEYERRLRGTYDNVMARLETDIQDFYSRYAKDIGLDYAEVRKRLNNDELKTYKQLNKEYMDEVERVQKNGHVRDYKEYLKEMSGRAYVTRVQELQDKIRHRVEMLTVNENQLVQDYLRNGYEDAYYRACFQVAGQSGLGARVDFEVIDERSIMRTLNQTYRGRNFSGSIWNRKDLLLENLNTLIPQEMARGKGANAIARTLSDRLEVSYTNAKRLVRTEMNFASNQATLEAWKSMGVVKDYQFLATLDSKTSQPCRDLDGKVFKVSQVSEGVNFPPIHPYCRSTVVAHFPDDDDNDDTGRAARDTDGNTYLLEHYVTYKQWASEHASETYKRSRFPDIKGAVSKIGSYHMTDMVLSNILNSNTEHIVNPATDKLTAFEQNLIDFTSGGTEYTVAVKDYIDGINNLANRYTEEQIRFAKTARKAIRKADSYEKTLYRIEEFGISLAPADVKQGHEFTLGLSSFSRTRGWISTVAQDMKWEAPVVFEVRGAKGINLKPYSPYRLDSEETAIAGRFRILEVIADEYGGVQATKVILQQIAD